MAKTAVLFLCTAMERAFCWCGVWAQAVKIPFPCKGTILKEFSAVLFAVERYGIFVDFWQIIITTLQKHQRES